MVMEFLEGVDLARTIRSGPISVELAAEYIAQACDALAEAHANGIVRRDFKPANLMVTKGLRSNSRRLTRAMPIDRIDLDCEDSLAGITLIAVTLEAPK